MTPLEELRADAVGEAFVALLYRQVAVVARLHRFPPIEGHRAWTVEAVHEAGHDFLADGGYVKLAELVARVETDEALARLLAVMVRNFFRQRGRKTTLGKLVRRLRNVLAEDERFMVVPDGRPGAGNVTLTGGNTEPYVGSPANLIDAARTVREVTVVRWSPSARREGPLADAPSLRALSAAVLEAAAGSLELVFLAEVVATRLGVDPRAVPAAIAVEDIDDLTAHGEADQVGSAEDPREAAAGRLERDEVVDAVLAQLSVRERLVLAWLHEPVRTIADRTGLAVSTAGAVKQRVTNKVLAMLSGLDTRDAETIALAARDSARQEAGLDPV